MKFSWRKDKWRPVKPLKEPPRPEAGLGCLTLLGNIPNAFLQEQPGRGSAGLQSEPQSLQASCAVRERVTRGGNSKEMQSDPGQQLPETLGEQRSPQPDFLSRAHWMLWWNPKGGAGEDDSGGAERGVRNWPATSGVVTLVWRLQQALRLLRDQAQQGFIKPSLQKWINKQSRVAAEHHLKEGWDVDVVQEDLNVLVCES